MTSYVDDNLFPKVLLVEGSAPTTPASGDQALFIDVSDHHLKRVDDTGTVTDLESGGGGGGGSPTIQLNYRAATDILNGASVTSATWTNVGPSNSFTLANTNHPVMISVGGMVEFDIASSAQEALCALLIDGSTLITIGGEVFVHTVGGENILAGVAAVWIDNLAAGSHTVQVQFRCPVGGTLYCLPSSAPTQYSFYVSVVEF